MHSELEGSPEEVLVLTGRIGCSGELRVQVWPEGEERPLFQGQRQIQLPAGARTAVFSIPITLPSQVWARPLRGELALTPSSWWDPEPSPQTLTIPFSIRCRSQEAGLLGAGIPLPQQQEEERLADAASPASTATLLSPERTLQKLLRIWQHSAPAGGDPGSTQPAEPSAKAAPEPNPQPAAPISPLPSPPQAEPMGEDAALPAPAGSPATPPPPAFALLATSKDTKNSPPPPEVCPAPQLLVPEQLRAGDNFDVVLRLPALAPASAAGAASQPPYWIKFWVKHGRTRSLVDGPRWLLDFSRDDQGQWQALTRMTIPPGVPELIFEAWAVSPDRQQQSDRVTEHRSILP